MIAKGVGESPQKVSKNRKGIIYSTSVESFEEFITNLTFFLQQIVIIRQKKLNPEYT